jgi:hypothetical protein
MNARSEGQKKSFSASVRCPHSSAICFPRSAFTLKAVCQHCSKLTTDLVTLAVEYPVAPSDPHRKHCACTHVSNTEKSSPSTRHGGAWGERRYSSYSFTTSALDRGEWSASRPGRSLPPVKGPPVPIVQEAGWAPEPV